MPVLSQIQVTPEELQAMLDAKVKVDGRWMKMSTAIDRMAKLMGIKSKPKKRK